MKIYLSIILAFVLTLSVCAQNRTVTDFFKFGEPLPELRQSAARKPKLPGNIARYENEYPFDLLKNAAVKARLRALLGKSYPSFLEAIDTQDPVERKGDLLIGKGCAKGLCTIYEAMIVIDLKAKTIHCGIVSTAAKTNKYKIFSESSKNIPAVLKEWTDKLLKER